MSASDPQATLAIFAEVAVALAGFSGIVIAFGRRATRALTALEQRRLSNLFMLSGLVLVVSLLNLSLLHLAALEQRHLWMGCSALIFVIVSPWLLIDTIRLRRLEAAERDEVKLLILVPFNTVGIVVLALQLFNLFSLQAPWPVFLALVVAIGGAFQQFILLVRSGVRGA